MPAAAVIAIIVALYCPFRLQAVQFCGGTCIARRFQGQFCIFAIAESPLSRLLADGPSALGPALPARLHMFDRGGAPWVFVHERAGSPLDDEAVA